MKAVGYFLIGLCSIPFLILGFFVAFCIVAGKWAVHMAVGEMFKMAKLAAYVWIFEDKDASRGGEG